MKKHLFSFLSVGMLLAALGCGGGGGSVLPPTDETLDTNVADLLAGVYDITLTTTAGSTCSDVTVGSVTTDTITVTTSETGDGVEISSAAGGATFTGTRSGNSFDVSNTTTTTLSATCTRNTLTEISGSQTNGTLTGTSTVTLTSEPAACAEECQTFDDVAGTRR